MNIRNFDDAFTLLIGNEGRYSDNAKDPGNWTGGKIGVGDLIGTMWGVSASVAREEGWTGRMQDMPIEFAQGVAKRRYWDRFQCSQFDPEIGFQIFDFAYQGGPAAKALQRAAGVTADGVIGAQTIASIRSKDKRTVIMLIDADRLDYLSDLSIWNDMSRGLAKRIAKNLREGAD